MAGFAVKNILKSNQSRAPGKAETDSNRHPGHENRMAGHIHRIRTHVCEHPNGPKCADCIKGKV